MEFHHYLTMPDGTEIEQHDSLAPDEIMGDVFGHFDTFAKVHPDAIAGRTEFVSDGKFVIGAFTPAAGTMYLESLTIRDS